VPHTANFNCNEKGSVSPEMLMHPLKFVDQVRAAAAKGQPDVWVMVLLEGVETHVTAPMPEFFAVNKIICGLRPPNTSHLVQNEDLVAFWQFRYDKDSGYNKVKQAHLAKLMSLAVSRRSTSATPWRSSPRAGTQPSRRSTRSAPGSRAACTRSCACRSASWSAKKSSRRSVAAAPPQSQKDLKKKASEQRQTALK